MNSPPDRGEALRAWLRIGLESFGGPAGQIAVMHRVLVDEKRWIDEPAFLHALQFCMLLPGPEAQQLATYVGWRLHGVPGGLAAGGLFVLPGALVMMGLAAGYAAWGGLPPVRAAFFGLQAAVLALVVQAVVRIGGKTLRSPGHRAAAAAAFLVLALTRIPFPWVVLGAGVLGALLSRGTEERTSAPWPPWSRTARTLAFWAALWWAPLLALAAWGGRDGLLFRLGLFFGKAAVVTFGGAYAVLAYMAQEVVQVHGWLAAREMIDGLALAETTPGPLILVGQFVGYLAAHHHLGGVPPALAGVLGAAVALWATFVPCFLWIFVGAPYVERLRTMGRLSSALSWIGAAVVGVIAQLAAWFGLHVLFGRVAVVERGLLRLSVPDPATLDPAAAALAALALLAVLRFRVGTFVLLAGGLGAGLGLRLLLG